MKNLLFIAYEFPPLNRGGVLRSIKFAKYLGEFGIIPHVFCLSPNSYSKVFDHYSVDELLLENGIGLNIYPVNSEELLEEFGEGFKAKLYNYFSIVGMESKMWRRDLYDKVSALSQNIKFDAVFISAPPFSTIRDGIYLKNKLEIPLILDMRDAWSNWFMQPYSTYFHYKFLLRYERKLLSKADTIITTSEQTRLDFIDLHGNISPEKFCTIFNGYDTDVVFRKKIHWELSYQKIKISYVGSFYFHPDSRELMIENRSNLKGLKKLSFRPNIQNWLYRTPYFFFKALSDLIKHNPKYNDLIELHFAGRKEDWLYEMVNEFELNEVFYHHGEVSHVESLALQNESDFLLLTSSKILNGKDYSIAGKTFEYFTQQKPILAFVAESAQKDILEESGLALIFDPDHERNAEKLGELFSKGFDLNPDIDFLKSLHRKNLTKKLSERIFQHIS